MDALLSRPDIVNAVRAVARYCSAPNMVHWKAALGILGDAVRTSRFGITFQRGTVEGFQLVSFTDADCASKATDRRSVSGGVVMCAGGAFHGTRRLRNASRCQPRRQSM